MSQTEPPSLQRPAPRRTILFGLALLVLVLALFAAGRAGYLPDAAEATGLLEAVSESPWGLAALIAVFCVSAFIGVPQFALIAAAVAVFGPWYGGAYAWVANLVSGAVTFWIGRAAGEEAFRRYAGKRVQQLSRVVGRNALAASAIVRNVPAGPFLLVNMAFGVSEAKFRDYWIGMAIGIIPKIALVAFAGKSIVAALQGNLMLALGAAAGAVAVYVAAFLYFRQRTAKAGQILPADRAVRVDSPARPGD
jgi:uncharacterized membrane protein YdjX (TVP38/TMEM64 family)